jgi:hypothetical protein
MVYQQSMKVGKPKESLLELLRKPPYVDLSLERDKDLGREVIDFANVKVKLKGKKSTKK